jgi:hypothetical protein
MSKFHINFKEEGQLVKISLDIDASANEVVNAFRHIATQHPDLAQTILAGLTDKEEDVTIN